MRRIGYHGGVRGEVEVRRIEAASMSTTHDDRPTIPPGSPADPFRLGWRYVRVERPDGTVDTVQIPLTPGDLLHPEEGDFQLHTDGHNEDCGYLKAVLKAHLAGDPSAVVLSDCRIAYDAPFRPLGPDVAVFLGVGARSDWSTFDAAEEGARPALVVEVTSPDTRGNDFGIKRDLYEQAGVPIYAIIDRRPAGGSTRVSVLGYRLTPDGYEPLEPGPLGRLWLEPVRLWLGALGDRAACFDPDTGREIGDYLAIRRELAAEAEARAAADARAAAADTRATEADARAAEADARAGREIQARAGLEARLRQMAEELRQARGGA